VSGGEQPAAQPDDWRHHPAADPVAAPIRRRRVLFFCLGGRVYPAGKSAAPAPWLASPSCRNVLALVPAWEDMAMRTIIVASLAFALSGCLSVPVTPTAYNDDACL